MWRSDQNQMFYLWKKNQKKMLKKRKKITCLNQNDKGDENSNLNYQHFTIKIRMECNNWGLNSVLWPVTV